MSCGGVAHKEGGAAATLCKRKEELQRRCVKERRSCGSAAYNEVGDAAALRIMKLELRWLHA